MSVWAIGGKIIIILNKKNVFDDLFAAFFYKFHCV